MIDRYPRTAGCRLDTNEDGSGPALDLYPVIPESRGVVAALWLRDQDGREAKLRDLDGEDLRALRDGINRILVEARLETKVMIQVPA